MLLVARPGAAFVATCSYVYMYDYVCFFTRDPVAQIDRLVCFPKPSGLPKVGLPILHTRTDDAHEPTPANMLRSLKSIHPGRGSRVARGPEDSPLQPCPWTTEGETETDDGRWSCEETRKVAASATRKRCGQPGHNGHSLLHV